MPQPIFLSYASQDADAARRICDALRAEGLEVWFDQNELAGGDAWDQKIRRQIKECSLFIPIISEATNAREEGYFRLEWKLAVDRTHLMADSKAFLLPVILDETPEVTALVPDKFREHQWLRIKDSKSIEDLAHRAGQILRGHGSPTHALPNAAQTKTSSSTAKRRLVLLSGVGAAVALVVGVAAWKRGSVISQSPVGATQPRDPQLIRAAQLIDRTDAIISDVDIAEELVKSVLDAHPADVDATVLMARVQTYYLSRGFDASSARSAKAKQFAERALTIAPDNPDAMAALGTYLDVRDVDPVRAGRLLRSAIALKPDEPRYYRALASTIRNTPGSSPDQVITLLKDILQKFPNDPLLHYDLAREYRNASMVPEMEHHLDQAIEVGKLDSAYVLRARYRLYLHGDIKGMKADLDNLSDRGRSTDRAILSKFTLALMSADPEPGVQALTSKPEPWIADYEFTGPTQLLLGELLLLQGKTELARQQFEFAIQELAKRKSDVLREIALMGLEVWLTMRLGTVQEAKNRNRLLLREIKRPYRLYLFGAVSFNPIPLNLLIGERREALALMRDAVAVPIAKTILRTFFNLDPRLVRFRLDKEINAILAPDDKLPVSK